MCPFVDISLPGREKPCELFPLSVVCGMSSIKIPHFVSRTIFGSASTQFLKVRFTLVNFPTNRVAKNQCRGLLRIPVLLAN